MILYMNIVKLCTFTMFPLFVPGDFAVLLRAGMSPKQAIIYNCLSSIFCFIGMVIGVAIGNIENANLWIFAVVGGMFLYIALVDMVGIIISQL